ncbi:MAG: cbb3-type cytochrome oxidase subunit 3 [Pseudomonadales bacterium]
MDINLLRSIATLLLFIAFVSICVMVFSRKRKDYYETASQIPLREKSIEPTKGEHAQAEARP